MTQETNDTTTAGQQPTDDAALERAAEQAAKQQRYWAIVRRQYRKNRVGMIALYIFMGLVLVALTAPLLANSVPIVAKYKG